MASADHSVPRRPILSFEAVAALLPIMDLAIVLITSVLAGLLVAMYSMSSSEPMPTSLYGLGLVASGLYVFRMRDLGHYEPFALRSGGVELRDMLQTWLISILVLVSLIYMFKFGQIDARHAFTVFVALTPTLLVASRFAVKRSLRVAMDHGAVGRRNVMLIGDARELSAPDLDEVLRAFGVTRTDHFQLEAAAAHEAGLTMADRAVINDAVAFARRADVEEALVLMDWSETGRLDAVRECLRTLPISARLLPDRNIRALTASSLAGSEALQVELQRAPLTIYERGLKRTMDVTLSLLALVILAPFLAVVALAVRLESSGPAIFRQRRIGFNRREFTIYKFRSMSVQEHGMAVRQATRRDARVTRLGRILRSTSIDEFPQLFNVLQGEMSLVGPRPHALVHDYEFEDRLGEYAFRRHVKPGITGWAQCKGRRGPTPSIEDVRARVELDLWYITNWSIGLDVYIVLRTLLILMSRKNAV